MNDFSLMQMIAEQLKKHLRFMSDFTDPWSGKAHSPKSGPGRSCYQYWGLHDRNPHTATEPPASLFVKSPSNKKLVNILF